MEPETNLISLSEPAVPAALVPGLDLHAAIKETIQDIDKFLAAPHVRGEEVHLIARSLKLVLTAVAGSMGECRLAVPYSPVYIVIEGSGTKYCCNHNPPHCT